MLKPEAFIVKICGITNFEDAEQALDAGANALGFNFYRKSPRYITPDRAQAIIERLRPSSLAVGVFVNADPTDLGSAWLDVVQLHGSVPRTDGLRVWRSIASDAPVPEPDPSVEMYLLDSFTPDYGGSGKTFEWNAAKGFPYPFLVAGGLDASNVAEAIRVLRPAGVDVCSRVERTPGRKDHAKVREFVCAAWAAHEAMLRQEVVL